MTLVPEFRVSYLATYHDCSRRGAARMFPKQVKEAGFSLASGDGPSPVYRSFGTAAHQAITYAAECRIDDAMPSTADMLDIGVNAFRQEIADGCEWDDTTRNINDAAEQIRRIVVAYHGLVLPGLKPVMVEKELKADGGTFRLIGHADIICPDEIRDIKTGAMSFAHYVQLGGYAILARAHKLSNPKRLVVDWFKRTRKHEPPLSVPSVENIDQYINIARATANRAIRDYQLFEETGNPLVAFPENPSSKLCSPKFCTAYGTDFCPITKR